MGSGEPRAAQTHRLVDVVDACDHAVQFRIDVVLAISADEAVRAHVPAGVAEHALRPAVLVAAAQRLLGGEHGMPQLLLGRECEVGRAMHLGVGCVGEEAERILDLP